MRSHSLPLLVGACIALGLAACGGPAAEPETMPSPSGTSTPESPPGPSDAEREELERLFNARADSARMNVNEADVQFMTGMISHHAQALVMAEMAPTHGASDSMKILTGRIINAQKDEIAVMQNWLRDRGRHAPEIEINGLELLVDGEHPMLMHGMLSDEQLAELDAARGLEWDKLFLEYMILHHEGAVMMVSELFAADGAANDDVAFKVASDIQVDQRTEIRRMRKILENLEGGQPK